MTSPYTGIAGQRLTARLAQFANMGLAGRITVDVHPVFYGAALCALAKNGGGIRPISIGSTLRQLVAKAACRSPKDAVVSKLTLTQLGFGVAHDAKAVVHAARSF